jgi:hypothetical protein
MKILRPFTATGGVFFPIGLPPNGTCEFSTKTCRKYCYAVNDSLYDFETKNITQEEMWEIYNSFINWPINKLINKIEKELDGLQTPILHWFGTGDCETKNIQRISEVIESVPNYIVQMGFTRNEELWKLWPNIFALTIEKLEYAEGKSGMFSIPNYIEGTSQMYSPDYTVRGGYCGPFFCVDLIDSSITHFVNCQVCREIKAGCFDRR